jgi:hypothetical protein
VKTFARALVLVALSGGSAPAFDQPAALPTYDIGYLWPLADATYEVTRIEDGQYVFEAPGATIRLTRTLGLAAVRRGPEFLELTTGAELTWPLKPGDWGTARADWRASRAPDNAWQRLGWGMTARRLTWSVEGWDDVTVGTTRVRALKIVYQMVADGFSVRDALEWEVTMWYAPDAGVVIRATERAFGFLSFELAPGAELAALRVRAGLPDLAPPPAASLDSRRRHRDAVETCVGRKCAVAPLRLQTD